MKFGKHYLALCNYSGAHLENFVKFESVFQKLDHLTCSTISILKLNEINGFIEERHNSKLLHVKWQGNRFKIDGEVAENHAILVDHF